jgi:hypothetical protein
MKRTLVTVLGSAALLVAVSPAARADSFLSLSNGATTLTCNNSTAVGVGLCIGAGFATALGSNVISYSGAIGGYNVVDITLSSNSPGTPAIAFALDTKTQIQNISAGATALTVLFAENNFALPAGSPLTLSASQSGTFSNATAGSSEAYTAWADAGNGLVPTVGVADGTPNCVSTGGAVSACATVGPTVNFARAGAFALNGRQIINLNQGVASAASFTANVNAQNVVPEPGSLVLLATGFIGLVGGRRVWRRTA